MLRHGYPINFIDGAVMGPVLAIVQAEIIYSFKYVIEKALSTRHNSFNLSMLLDDWQGTFGFRIE